MRALALSFVAWALTFGAAQAAAPAVSGESSYDMTLGRPKAPVTVSEFASVGCSHCAAWEQTVFPAFKKKYIDTGKVRFVFHEMLTGDSALAAAGFLTARCAGPRKYFQVVDAVFAAQDEIAKVGAAGPLARIAENAGLSQAKFDACLKDEAAIKALDERTQADSAAHGVRATPTFLVGKQKLVGKQSLADLDAAIALARH